VTAKANTETKTTIQQQQQQQQTSSAITEHDAIVTANVQETQLRLGCVSLARGGRGNWSQEVKTLGSQAISGDRRWWGPHVGPVMCSRAFRRFPVSHAERAVSTAHRCDWAGVWLLKFIFLFYFPGVKFIYFGTWLLLVLL
jgi:DNA-directed RNA polymerase beta' subunit